MNAVDLVITFRARAVGDGFAVAVTATSTRDNQRVATWQRRLDPWLHAGAAPGLGYLDFGTEAAFIRFEGGGKNLPWLSARVLVGPSSELTGGYALELSDEAGGGVSRVAAQAGQRRQLIEQRARSADAVARLTPVLAHALREERRVTMPPVGPQLAEAVMWGLLAVLRMTGDTTPVSFLTSATGASRSDDTAGMLVSFRADVPAPLPPDPGFAALAADLAGRFAADPAGLRATLASLGVPGAADARDRVSRLLTLPPRAKPGGADRGGTPTVTINPGDPLASTLPPTPTPTIPVARVAPAEPAVMCPMCLGDIRDWDSLDFWRWDPTVGDGEYVRIDIPSDLNPVQRARFTHGAYIRCPASSDVTKVAHYLPARYGQFGPPVLLGFVGLTQSGKTHLLASMIGELGRLSEFGIDVTELDRATHHDFLENSVKPLIAGNKVLPGTPDDATTTLTDAFIIRRGTGPGSERVVALFDVSGGDLARRDTTKEFLWIANGLFFVIDPDHIKASKVGDDTFSNVLDIMGSRPSAQRPSAAIVLNKADKVRFEEPVARWLRAGNGDLDPAEFLRESADVYAYLEQQQATALIKPYLACAKATLHVASPTGGAQEGEDKASRYPRGVTPQRVLRPLVAMLAMTGVLTGPQVEQIGV
ncbi:MAG TPA: hypothetical protein VH478_16405 [Trebonia sp.]|nr:hypothetical protein [Trebonia sp.]